jgi:hypothetical protein
MKKLRVLGYEVRPVWVIDDGENLHRVQAQPVEFPTLEQAAERLEKERIKAEIELNKAAPAAEGASNG